MHIRVIAVAAAWLLAGPSLAEPVEIGQVAQGAVYYNRPGATLADHNAELDACMREAPSPPIKPAVVGGNMGDSLMFHWIWDKTVTALAASKVEACMIVRGWRAVRIPAAESAGLAALDATQFAERVGPWIGGSIPHGEIVRSWANEAAHPTGYKTASRAALPAVDHVSLRLYREAGLSPPPYEAPPPEAKLDPRWPVKALKPTELASAPTEAGLIVLRVTGVSNRWGTGVGFARVGATPEARPSREDLAPDGLYAGIGFLFAKKEGNWFVLAVPPGRWRIAGSGFMNYCLGSPSFEVKAGEVIYAGTFHLDGDDLGPDLALEPAKTYLGGSAADRVQAAVYRNGARGSCKGIGAIYALEIPGRPFEPGYAWGSAPAKP